MEGHCLCGAVRIELADPGASIEICQCEMCRRWGGAFYAGLSGGEATVAGEEHVSVYRSSEWAERAFCDTCGSNLWFRFLPTGTRSFLAGLFDGAARLPVEREIFVDESVQWTCIAGSHPRLTGEEILAEARAEGFDLG